MKSLDPVPCDDRGPLLMCPLHASEGGGQNQPRNRNPLLQCCSLNTAEIRSMKRPWSIETAEVRSLQESSRHSQLMLRNIQIPARYYTSTDPRTLPSHVIRSLVSQEARSGGGGQGRRLVSLSRSSSSVSVQRARTVKLRTSVVSRSQSFSDQGTHPVYSNVTRRRLLIRDRDSAQEESRMQQSVSRKYFQEPEERSLAPSESLLSKLSATLSSNILPWEYKLAGIGSCWRGR